MENGFLYCNIIDQGPGINSDWLENVFEEFVVEDIQQHQEGFGLGLAITKRTIELHNGSINVENDKALGTNFIIKLPV